MLNYRRLQMVANRATQDLHSWYSGHRRASMARIRESFLELERKAEKIVVVGAGNGNDLEFEELLELCPEVWLADIDAEALKNTLNRYALKGRVHTWVGDAGGGVMQIDRFRRNFLLSQDNKAETLQQLSRELLLADYSYPAAAFDVVVSQCVLSQIHWPVADSVWDYAKIPWDQGQRLLRKPDASWRELARALKVLTFTHLKWLAAILRPGGIAVITTDVSWQGVPLYGTDVEEIWEALAREQGLGSVMVKISDPKTWIWDLDDRTKATVTSTILHKTSKKEEYRGFRN